MTISPHALLARYATCMVDHTDGDAIPPGWLPILALLLRDMAEVLAAYPGRQITVGQIGPRFGRLRIHVDCGSDADGLAISGALHPLIVAAEARSAGTCQHCGAPGRRRPGPGIWTTVCGRHAASRVPDSSDEVDADDSFVAPDDEDDEDDEDNAPTLVAALCRPASKTVPLRGPHRLYTLRAVADAIGRPADLADDERVPRKTETEHEERLATLLRQGQAGTWRNLAEPSPAIPARLDALDTLAPHMAEVTALVRRHVRAALTVGLPITLPPVMMLGEPGVGKSWYFARLGEILGVPTRTYPMSASTLGEGLQGAHPSWRNAGPGLVAKTLLQEDVANPLILVDEVDKAQGHGWNNDPYRPFYAALEPASAKVWVDEYLGFAMDASRVSWLLAGNTTAPLPDPILSRLTVIAIPPLSREALAAVVTSIYADANKRMRDFFDPTLATSVRDSLLALTPRSVRLTLEDAMVRAAAAGRRSLRVGDLHAPARHQIERIGFVTSQT